MEKETDCTTITRGFMRSLAFILIFSICFPALPECIPALSDSAIFGFRKGMNLEQIEALRLGTLHSLGKDAYVISQPSKLRGASKIALKVPSKEGLLKVVVVWEVTTNEQGDQIKEKFNEIHTALTKKYGIGEKYDLIKTDSLWKDPKYWMKGISNKERTLLWLTEEGQVLPHGLVGIILEVTAKNLNKAKLFLHYEFQGNEAYAKK